MCVIKLNEVYKPKKNYTVIVKTVTFNHSKYIEDTLNGISNERELEESYEDNYYELLTD